MTSQHSVRVRGLRRFVLAGSLAAATFATVGLPLTAHAAPSKAASAAARRGVDDPAGDAATNTLALMQRAITSHDASTMKAYDAARDRIATTIAARLEIDPATMQAAWQDADHAHQQALLAALSQLGVPYRRNASKPGEGFDCSGLTTYAWAQTGLELQRQSSAQIRASGRRDETTAQAGDLVQYPGHVMVWLGVERAIVHAPYSGRNVEVDRWSARRSVRYGDPTG